MCLVLGSFSEEYYKAQILLKPEPIEFGSEDHECYVGQEAEAI